MLYIIIAVAIICILFVLFRDDHDRSYDNRDIKSRPSTILPPEQPAAPRDKTTVPTPVRQMNPVKPVKKVHVEPERELSWTYLYSLEFDDGIVGDIMETEISGMNYYCTPGDAGPVNGIVRPEPDNPHDPRAQVVIRSDGKKLGYIPRYALDEYEVFNSFNLVCPFAGRVVLGRRGWIHADIMVALPESRDFVKEKLSEYME